MPSRFEGRVLYDNGYSAPGVKVRIFDKDAPGKIDDDLTEEPGLSDQTGHFTLLYHRNRFRDSLSLSQIELFGVDFDWSAVARNIRLPDLTDEYQPYLLFEYTYQGQETSHSAPVGYFQHEFRLPQAPPLQFRPAIHGFQFVNNFPGYPLPFSMPALPGAGKVSPAYGLCGGMSSGALDFLLSGRPIPQVEEAPRSGTRLHRYLYRRAIDTFGSFGESLLKVAGWMRLPEEGSAGAWSRTLGEFSKVRARLEAQHGVILALVYTGADTLPEILKEIWNNHQVLAYAWSQVSPDAVEIHVYDPNYPKHDDVRIRGERVSLGEAGSLKDDKVPVFGLRCEQRVGNQVVRKVRGSFPMPYIPVEPPAGLS